MLDRKTIGIRLMLLRQARNLNQGDLANLLKLDQSKLSRLEKGEYKNLDLDLLERVLQEFACPAEMIFHEDGDVFLNWLSGNDEDTSIEAFSLRSFFQAEKNTDAMQISNFLTSQIINSKILIYGLEEAGKTSFIKALLREAKIADVLILDSADQWSDWSKKHTLIPIKNGDALTLAASATNRPVTVVDGWSGTDAKEIGLYRLLRDAPQGVLATINAPSGIDAIKRFDDLISARAGKASSADLSLPTGIEYYDLLLEVVKESRGDRTDYHLQRAVQPFIDREGHEHFYTAYARASRRRGQAIKPLNL